MNFRIFICYSQEDFYTPGGKIQEYLSRLFPDSYVYIDQIKSKGQKWRPENERELRASDLIVVIMTPAALQSKEIENEIKISIKTSKRILPCKDENLGLKWEALPYGLGDLDGIDFEDEDQLKRRLHREIKKIRKEISKKSIPSKLEEKNAVFVETDKTSYSEGETIMVTGKVSEILFGYAISLMVIAPNGNVVVIDQVLVGSDKKYSTELTAGGSLMKASGEYTVQVLYGTENRTAETTFTFGEIKISPPNNIVKLPSNSSVPNNKKFAEPEILQINVGESVEWINEDTAAHTITSGNLSEGPDGVFDSSLFMAGTTFQMTFKEKGTYHYFCMVHPWKECVIQVD